MATVEHCKYIRLGPRASVWICEPWNSYLAGIEAECEAERLQYELEEDLRRSRELDWAIPLEYRSEIIPADVALAAGLGEK